MDDCAKKAARQEVEAEEVELEEVKNVEVEELEVTMAAKNLDAFKMKLKRWAWWLIGSFVAFRPKGPGFEFHSSRHAYELCASPSLAIACGASL